MALLTASALGGAAVIAWRDGTTRGGDSVPSPRLDASGAQTIQASRADSTGLGRWISRYLNEILAARIGAPGVAGDPVVTIHREPFSQEEARLQLSTEARAARERIETQAIESHVTFAIPTVPPEQALLFLLFSDFRSRIEGVGTLERKLELRATDATSPPLETRPELAPNEVLCYERLVRPEPLALPTAAYYVFDARREGEAFVLSYELWENTGDDSHAPIHLSSGQFRITSEGDGSRVHLASFFAGQSLPSLFDGIVEKKTIEFLRAFAQRAKDEAPAWQPGKDADAWIESASL